MKNNSNQSLDKTTKAFLKFWKANRPKNQEVISIGFCGHGKIQTKYSPYTSANAIDIGIMLASATRTISAAITDMLNLPDSELEQIQAQIVEVYNNDMKMPSMGEEESVKAHFKTINE